MFYRFIVCFSTFPNVPSIVSVSLFADRIVLESYIISLFFLGVVCNDLVWLFKTYLYLIFATFLV